MSDYLEAIGAPEQAHIMAKMITADATPESAARTARELSPTVLRQAVDRIVAAARPDRIILFGSAARGTMGPHSDVDLLVIKSGAEDRRSLTAEIYRHLRGVPAAFDIVVATPEEIAQFGESPAYVFSSALREGRAVYADRAVCETAAPHFPGNPIHGICAE